MYTVYLCRPSEASTRYCAIPGGYSPQDWEFAVCRVGVGFEPRTTDLQSGALPLSHLSSLHPHTTSSLFLQWNSRLYTRGKGRDVGNVYMYIYNYTLHPVLCRLQHPRIHCTTETVGEGGGDDDICRLLYDDTVLLCFCLLSYAPLRPHPLPIAINLS